MKRYNICCKVQVIESSFVSNMPAIMVQHNAVFFAR